MIRVFLSTVSSSSRFSARSLLRIAARRPRIALSWVRVWAIRAFTLSRFHHISVGNDAVVFDRGFAGDAVYPTLWYIENMPRLAWMLTLPGDLAVEPMPGRLSVARIVLSRLTLGLIDARDCCWCARRLLASAGYRVPARLSTPESIASHLIHERNAHATPLV